MIQRKLPSGKCLFSRVENSALMTRIRRMLADFDQCKSAQFAPSASISLSTDG
jgi:hypothetical protein